MKYAICFASRVFVYASIIVADSMLNDWFYVSEKLFHFVLVIKTAVNFDKANSRLENDFRKRHFLPFTIVYRPRIIGPIKFSTDSGKQNWTCCVRYCPTIVSFSPDIPHSEKFFLNELRL